MAELVAVYTVPHTPSFVADVQQTGDTIETARFFSEIRSHLEKVRPDVIVSVTNDHFNTFFFDNWPTFAIGVADKTAGPSDQTPGMPWYDLTVESAAARHILRGLVKEGFDFSSTVDFQLDHGTLVPLHFLTPDMSLPIVPIFVNCIVPPLPPAQRCYGLGRAISGAIGSWHKNVRVAVIASGSLSLEIGGPRVDVDKTFGVPDPAWANWILDRIGHCEHDDLVSKASEARMLEAGNVAGELLNWIVALGMVGLRPPEILLDQPKLGNAFAAWNLEESQP
ncbi:extradiol ring-cleavage dioxygenase [Ruegeria sp. 2205SS24-7]|uniref:DODA-type extradiol aromatic ring-opening family dioxygenase n=1 Tax=Ruegeria discodermiae TaxID=3064389 RepID=UPI0027417B16|nr:extradiol ring-cleavage dioxygenase [Ruegeria sp. 2205SS24-7]MDP5218986.1 extradiol ring-cleavage dioxygenase [Ruegeria sp. 2205SS24-7]